MTTELMLHSIDSAIIADVRVSLKARLGEVTLPIQELLSIQSGTVLKLDLRLDDLIELRLNEVLVARGEIVAVDDNFGVRISQLHRAGIDRLSKRLGPSAPFRLER